MKGIAGPLHEDLCKRIIISRWTFHRIRNILGTLVEKIKPRILCLIITFPKSCLMWDNLGKYGRKNRSGNIMLHRIDIFMLDREEAVIFHAFCITGELLYWTCFYARSLKCDRRVLASSCLSVCPNVPARVPLGRLHEIWYWLLSKSVEKF
jgi:hypothetical protein